MAVSSETTYTGPLIANGVTTAFPWTFLAMAADEIEVYGLDADGEEVALPDFTAALSGTAPATGTVTFNTAPTNGTRVWIASDPDFLQEIAFENGSRWLADPVNQANDRAALRSLMLKRETERSVKLPIGEDGITLPAGSGPTLYTSVNTLAGIADEIEAVANNNADVSTVADNLNGANTIGTVAEYAAEVNAVGDNIAAILAVNADAADIGSVATDLNGDDSIGTVADSIAEVAAVGSNIGAVLNADDNMAEIIDAPNQAALSRLYAISDTDAPIVGAVSTADRGSKYYADIAEDNATNVGNLLAQQAAQMIALQIIVANAFT